MRVDVIPIKELSEDMKKDWLRMQVSNPNFMGPSFHPELFVSVGKYCPDVYVALLYKENNLAGFLPFLKNQKLLAAQPIRLCNFEGIISFPNQSWDINLILKKMGLYSWNFKAMVNSENIKSKIGNRQAQNSFRMDLTCGLEEYWAFIKTKKVELKSLIVKRRSLENKMGPLHFIANCNNIKALHQLIQWKATQYNRDLEWTKLTTEVFEYIYNLKNPLFQGILSTLYAGDELLAANFALRYRGHIIEVHRAFNPNFSKYSVGILILHDLINEYKALEYSIYDFGPGAFQYKQDYSNSSISIIEGSFKVNSFKERIKSITWLYKGLLPIAQIKRKCMTKFLG